MTNAPDARERRPAPALLAEQTERLAGKLQRPLVPLWARGFRMLFVLDAFALYGLMVIITTLRFGRDWPSWNRYLVGFAIATAIHLVVNYLAGLYEREPRLGRRPWLGRVLVATAIGVAFQGLGFLLLDRYLQPRLNLIWFLGLATIALTVNRHLSAWLTDARLGPPRIVLVGPEELTETATAHLADSNRDAVVAGRVRDPLDLTEAVTAGRATDVLLLDIGTLDAVFPEPLSSLEHRGVGFLQRISARETLLGVSGIRQVAGMPFVRLRVHTVASHKFRLKRLFDLLVSLVTAPLWLAGLAALVLYVRLRAGRPVFYRQTRVGRDGKHFEVLKFRTMVVDAEQAGAVLAAKSDSRVVPGLGWMRDTRADELPQMLNVVRGQMSIVGPRPERPELVAEIEQRVPGYARRLELPPGLTGLAQVYGRYHTTAEYKLGYDLQYLANWSPMLDLQILARTIWVVVSRRV